KGEREALLKSLYVSVDPAMRGFIVFDFKDQFEQAKDQLGRWYNSGKLTNTDRQWRKALNGSHQLLWVCFTVKILANSWSKYRDPKKFSFFVTICLLNPLV